MGGFNTMKTQMLLKYNNCRIILYWEKNLIIQNYISAFQMWPLPIEFANTHCILRFMTEVHMAHRKQRKAMCFQHSMQTRRAHAHDDRKPKCNHHCRVEKKVDITHETYQPFRKNVIITTNLKE